MRLNRTGASARVLFAVYLYLILISAFFIFFFFVFRVASTLFSPVSYHVPFHSVRYFLSFILG